MRFAARARPTLSGRKADDCAARETALWRAGGLGASWPDDANAETTRWRTAAKARPKPGAVLNPGPLPGFLWRIFLVVAGPGLVAMLADTDAGSVITVAQSGAQWGYRLLLSNLLFIPFMFFAQELALRIGLGARQGAVELARRRFGRAPALLLLAVLAASCFGALVSELSRPRRRRPGGRRAGRRDHGARRLRSDGDGGDRLLSLGRARGAVLRPVRDRLPGDGVARRARRSADRRRGAAHRRRATRILLPCSPPISAPASFPGRCSTSRRPPSIRGSAPAHLPAARIETLIGVVICQAITSALSDRRRRDAVRPRLTRLGRRQSRPLSPRRSGPRSAMSSSSSASPAAR